MLRKIKERHIVRSENRGKERNEFLSVAKRGKLEGDG